MMNLKAGSLRIAAKGEGFAAGNDVGEFAATARDDKQDEKYHVVRCRHARAKTSSPLMAAVNGRSVNPW